MAKKKVTPDTKTEALNRKIGEMNKPKKKIKVKFPNGYVTMMNVEIAKRLERRKNLKIVV